MHLRTALAVVAVSPLFDARIVLAADEATTPETSLETRRANVERAEDELRLRKREENVAAEHRALDAHTAERERARFSHAGRVVFPNLAGLSVMSVGSLQGADFAGGGLVAFSTQSETGPQGGMIGSTISFNPAVDVFVTDHFTVGGTASASRTESTSGGVVGETTWALTSSSGYGMAIGPRIGRTFDLGPVTIWPTVSGRYRVDRAETMSVGSAPSGRSVTRALAAVLSVDVVFPIGRYLMFSVGPTLSYEHASTEVTPKIGPTGFESDRMVGGVHGSLGVTL